MTPREASYHDALTRLRTAQRAYEALRDPRADWQHVAAACKAVVIARADLARVAGPCGYHVTGPTCPDCHVYAY